MHVGLMLIYSFIHLNLGADSDGKCARFESLFNETPLGKKISNIIRDDKNKLIEHYLRDFIHMNVFGRDIYQHKVCF